ncbi:MAG: 6,7-dimethyl-8-ribityllumazine synthase [Deltaproteobacteria bacterium]|nr:6,7-dimethyl-8-ribityllumazine synthase [Deltaproteobacteria bacterium]MBI2342301.1 6,7-dimethyl-8-ribityllumazine synthase [Deltaproteobacteria bacterium]MBI2974336.1 6,7-dimethyl-8-ribityllumazine synthase [Deltaproteobacteria bacterium]
MPKTLEGTYESKGQKIAIVVGRFNSMISDRLLSGAVSAFVRGGGDEKDVAVVKVPGSFEIPLTALKLAQSKKYDGILCLGAVIRGGTPHFDYIANEVAKGIAQVNFATGVPTAFGIITADNLEQAIERAGAKQGNKGEEAMLALIETINVLKKI